MVLLITRLDWRGRMNFLSKRSISRSALARWPGCWINSSSWMSVWITKIIVVVIMILFIIMVMMN